MKISLRISPFAPLLGLLLSGCTASSPATVSTNPLRQLAASVVAARAYDQVVIARRRGDIKGLEAASAEVNRALIDPYTPLGKARSLNEMGYLLAENGTTKADFDKAVTLTASALKEMDKIVALFPASDQRHTDAIADRAIGARDSYAWALFKAGRFSEARSQEEQALSEIKEAKAEGQSSPEIPFHMAEIHRVLHESDKARAQYEAALKMNPDAVLRGRIEASLHALTTTRSV